MVDADAAVAIVHARGDSDSVLVMRRAERQSDSWSGHWSFPGGRREPQDPDLLHTALRELAEECGVRLAPDRLETALPLATARRRVGRYLQVAPFVLAVDREHPPRVDLHEAVAALWVPVDMLRNPANHALLPIPGLPPHVRFPAVDLNGFPLWGFTYRLIAEWLKLNPPDFAAAGLAAAQDLLAYLASRGCPSDQRWTTRDGVKLAAVAGPIPAADVLRHAALPAPHIPWLNTLEASSTHVRLIDLGFQEYRIVSSA